VYCPFKQQPYFKVYVIFLIKSTIIYGIKVSMTIVGKINIAFFKDTQIKGDIFDKFDTTSLFKVPNMPF